MPRDNEEGLILTVSKTLKVQYPKLSQSLSVGPYRLVLFSTMCKSVQYFQHLKLCKVVNSVCFKTKTMLGLDTEIVFRNLLTL